MEINFENFENSKYPKIMIYRSIPEADFEKKIIKNHNFHEIDIFIITKLFLSNFEKELRK